MEILYGISLIGKILASYIVLKQVDEKSHLPTLAPAKVRFIDDYVDHRGTVSLAAIMLPPYT